MKFEFFLDPDNPATRYQRRFLVCKDGHEEDWIKWLMSYREI
jgi:hypothetical protein